MLKGKIEKIRLLDQHAKSKWVFGTSAILIVIVFSVWLHYFNAIVTLSPDKVASEEPVVATGFSVGDFARSGLAAVGEGFSGAIRFVGGKFSEPKDYQIEPK